MTCNPTTNLRPICDAQIELINAQNLYIVELEARLEKLHEDLPAPLPFRFKKYYEDQQRQLEEFRKKSS